VQVVVRRRTPRASTTTHQSGQYQWCGHESGFRPRLPPVGSASRQIQPSHPRQWAGLAIQLTDQRGANPAC